MLKLQLGSVPLLPGSTPLAFPPGFDGAGRRTTTDEERNAYDAGKAQCLCGGNNLGCPYNVNACMSPNSSWVKMNSAMMTKIKAGNAPFAEYNKEGNRVARGVWWGYIVPSTDGAYIQLRRRPTGGGALDIVGGAVGDIAVAAGDVIGKIANLVCTATGDRPSVAAVKHAQTEYNKRYGYGDDAEARAANAKLSATDLDARVAVAKDIACKFDAVLNKDGATSFINNPFRQKSGTIISATKLVSFYHKRRKTWLTWKLSASGAALSGINDFCSRSDLAGLTVSELEEKARAAGASYVGETSMLPANATVGGEVDDPWYKRPAPMLMLGIGILGAAFAYVRFRK